MPVKKYSESSKMRAKMPENAQKVHFLCVFRQGQCENMVAFLIKL